MVTYYDILRWAFDCLPTTKTSTRWRIAYFYTRYINPKDYEFISNVFNSYATRYTTYAAFRKTFYYFAGSFEEKPAGQYLKSRYFKDPYM